MATLDPQYIFLGERLISEFLTMIKNDLLDYMQAESRNATGKSSRSLEITDVTNNSGKLVGHNGIEYVFRGRGPGKMPPIGALIDWANARGLPRSVAWAVATIIAKSGTKLWQQGRNVLNEIITEEKLNKLRNDILVTFTANLSSEISSLIAAA